MVQLKGRAACELDTADELLTTELMFNGVFGGLDKHQLVALVSCLVPVEKSNVRTPSSADHAADHVHIQMRLPTVLHRTPSARLPLEGN